MNRKFSHEPITKQTNSQHHQSSHNTKSTHTTPYIQLLESRKKVHGYRYDPKNIKAYTNYIKPSPSYISTIFANNPKTFKYISTDKNKPTTNDKRKRTKTQHQDKMQKSMFVNTEVPQKHNVISKSLYYDQAEQQYAQPQNNKRKRHLSENKHQHSDSNNMPALLSNALETLNVTDIDGLICLIDNCVREANQYVAFLSERLNSIKEELTESNKINRELEGQIYRKNEEIVQKDQTIIKLQKENSKNQSEQNQFQVNRLLETVRKISEQNSKLRSEISDLRSKNNYSRSPEKSEYINYQKPEFYNEIHSKIDILNIEISKQKSNYANVSITEPKNKNATENKTFKTAVKHKV